MHLNQPATPPGGYLSPSYERSPGFVRKALAEYQASPAARQKKSCPGGRPLT